MCFESISWGVTAGMVRRSDGPGAVRLPACSGLVRRLAALRLCLAVGAAQLGACAEPAVPPPQETPRPVASAPAAAPPDPSDHWCDLRTRVCR
ncbi:hypothetical protein [Aquabacterium humicola]|uniref:hypothetical protein n=1 Tax=Aquabacterium humicola TaxID=3237377 RepID=UPI00254323CD|nr:hypothetical protein [Rubrivivax pictus]